MGRKGATETLSVVLLAFLEKRTWRQKDLERHAKVERKTLVALLVDLQAAGLPLDREEESPNVYWSVPNTWFPGAIAIPREHVTLLVRVLRRAPKSEGRDRLLGMVSAGAFGAKLVSAGKRSGGAPSPVVTALLTAEEEAHLSVLEGAAEQGVAVRMRYYTLSRQALEWRHVSVHQIVSAVRFVGTCHRSKTLKWFRLDGVLAAEADEKEAFRTASPEDVQRYSDESVSGYHSGSQPVRCVFRVAASDAAWVKAQLPCHCDAEEQGKETRFSAKTAGLLPLARFVVGLGEAATVETEELGRLVKDLARGVLRGEQKTSHEMKTAERPSGTRKRTAG